ncbi:hypothetical protein M5C72_07170 [Companilactobacillus allii]|uniref:Uncharacterized protein n=1 Tax=Companilactobacillus allii TaxID=1847728 RepID=A0A1P8Q4U9_9LACO|nr:hypothetical protein [Companilactobacillus allii]APX72878.1 hypothetical protein BTM29_10085 [Companilactobacillus allii]USQ67666.1 hypothetical protein M5C72_07170 [Companilactobacillus allii]
MRMDIQSRLNNLNNWFKDNQETVLEEKSFWNNDSYYIHTKNNEYIWNPKSNELYLKVSNEYERVLYPNRVVETSLWGE